jgi:hypothetical protein
MQELERLLEEASKLRQESREAEKRLQEAEQAVLAERFKDWPQYKVGDVVLVPRKLFGEIKMWPAQIRYVKLNYEEGWYRETYKANPGGHWESQRIYYTVVLQQKDGKFTGTTDAFGHDQVMAVPDEVEASDESG